MRALVLFMFFVIAVPALGLGQKKSMATVSGQVLDSISRTGLEAATISIFEVSDSSLVNYTISDSKGNFQVRSVPTGQQLKMIISFSGSKTFVKLFTIEVGTTAWRDSFLLGKSYTELDEVVVIGERPPVVFKKDTVEFNAGSFKTKPNAVVEDLLKQLPGVEVDKDGNITVNGKPVSKITVDGKDFFGGDPAIAIKNLPKDVVDKIQVADNKTKEAIFNKTTDGNEDKAINITLKKDKKKGWFGRATAGYGSADRYEAGASINYYKGKNQVSFIGSLNNTNRMNFNSGNGRSGNGQNGGTGITESGSAGLNFSTDRGRGFRISGSYFYSESTNQNNGRRRRENILPDTSFFYQSTNANRNRNGGHNFSVNGDLDIDTLTHLNFNAGANLRNGRSLASNNSFSEDLKGNRINSSVTDYLNRSRSRGLNMNMFLSRKLNNNGRGLSLTVGLNNNGSDNLNDNIGLNTYTIGGVLDTDSLNQRGIDDNDSRSLNIAITYNEPITKTLKLIFRAAWNNSINNSERRVNNLDVSTGKYEIADSALSNSFRNTNQSVSPGLTLNYSNKKFRAAIGNSVSFLRQDNYSVTKDSLLRQRYVNFFPNANIGFQRSATSNISFNYNGRTQQPSIQQLQPVADNRNPLYIRLGNPDLQPSFTHSLNLNLQSQKAQGKSYLFGGLNYNVTSNQITQEVYYDSAGRQISRPLNTDGNYGGGLYFNYGRTWKSKKRSMRMVFGSNINLNHNTVFNNKMKNLATSYGLAPNLSFTYDLDNKFDISTRYNIRFNDTKYSIEQRGQMASGITQNIQFDVNVHITKKLTFESDINTNYNNRIAAGFRKSVTSWTAAVNLKLLKKEQGNLRFVIYDILKQNTSVYRTISQTYIEDVQQDVLQQYFLVSFTYNLRKF